MMMRAKTLARFHVVGVSTWLKDNETGFLVEAKNVEDLVKHMAILLKGKNTYKNFATRARTIAQKEFSVENHMSVLKETYQNVLQS